MSRRQIGRCRRPPSTWTRAFINQTWSATTFTVAYVECGVTGTAQDTAQLSLFDAQSAKSGSYWGIEFSGHIEGSIFGGLEHIVVAAQPIDLGVDVNLEARIKGSYYFEGKDWAS
jgi:hypothetical protein